MNKKNISQQQSDSYRWSTLMVSAQAGNESDYQQLLSELANVIHAYLRKRLGNQNFIEDCVQESLLAIHKARHTYDPKRPFRPWFFTIVRHKMIDYLRHKKTFRKIIEHHQQEEEIRNQGVQPNMLEHSIDNGSLLNALPTQYKEVLTLTKLLGFTGAETAKQLGISESAVKVRVHRAINKLRQIIEAED
ncbi:RNA polymerase sigma factor [Thalassotalea psychrophila]|uniref:RNA polymerase sigma factor n=1 Tax=Thalassotalea psychrophila TaxID=3065647 RepID=A0ABY9TTA6_9GAMM|nr:RNA polymerase sigma factor [Colwelliaceae bacterium SQ149]